MKSSDMKLMALLCAALAIAAFALGNIFNFNASIHIAMLLIFAFIASIGSSIVEKIEKLTTGEENEKS